MRFYLVFILILFSVNGFSQRQIIAHRGASSIAPENTMASFTKAIELGVECIEVDIRFSKEDSLMVIHDETLDRTTGGSGDVDQFSYDELKSLSAGYEKKFGSKFTNEKIPTLFEVLNLAKGKVKVCMDIKNSPEGPVLDLVEKMSMKSSVYIMSYNVEKLRRIKSMDSQIQTVFIKNTLTSIDLEVAKEIGAHAVSGAYISLLSLVDEAHKKGLKFWIGIVNDPAKTGRMFNHHVDAVFTDYPQLMTMNTEKQILAHPNPFCDYVTIRLKRPENVQEIYIVDFKGAIVQKFEKPFTSVFLWNPGKDLRKGWYLIYVVNDEKINFEKILYN
ncbi:MAG: glycerophosphodiester phosphodiesterase family protein [Bacteroidales bacterium]